MTPNPALIKSVEQLNYRVTVGDVAAQAGLEINQAQQGLLALASEAGGHLQVAESGDIAYLFPKNFRSILRNKYLRLRLKEWWDKIWAVLFYLMRISFGIILIVSIVLIFAAIAIIIITISASDSDNNSGGSRNRSGGGGIFFFPRFWIGPDIFWFFDPNYSPRSRQRSQNRRSSNENELNFLEAVFSFLFGDGNPNADLEARRWQQIGAVIRNHRGAVVAEQIIPYLDNFDNRSDNEDALLPVLTRFNGYPEVSPEGEIIYYFPELQVTAKNQSFLAVSEYLQEHLWRFSRAGSGQLISAAALGAVNIIGALVLNSLLQDGQIAAQIGGLVAFVDSIYWLLLGYGTAFLTIPLLRYFWIQWKNSRLQTRNQKRETRALALNSGDRHLQQKINYARQFATEKVIGEENLTYSTETDLLDQEIERSAQIDAEWERRLDSGA
ncbi:MAG: hypothetical protein SAJ37_11475 [Oscillatoria sp. PMC 1068.18]|nr:hypothetical protein [Oscillatoria sp. PMC 1076.18]MEC4989359.1 hypothetical protein [Oscillatoria sp. PMC 1068.18]